MPNVNLFESETNASGLYGGFSGVEIKFTESFLAAIELERPKSAPL